MQKFKMGEWVKYKGNKCMVIGYQSVVDRENRYLVRFIDDVMGWFNESDLTFTTVKEDKEGGEKNGK